MKKYIIEMKKKLSKDKFIDNAIEIHGNKYDYSDVNIINCKNKIKIICPEHGEFYQRPTDHYRNGCPKCGKYSNTKKFIEKSIRIHEDKYDYSNVVYINNITPVEIVCKEHGKFFQKPLHHLFGCDCPICSRNKFKLKKEDFIKKSIKVHGNIYDYSRVEINGCKKIEILCKNHGPFFQTPDNHQRGKGCPVCNESHGERHIREYLKQRNIDYIKGKEFDDCKYKRKLKFDFYLPKYNICIEFDGQQHFHVIEHFGGEQTLIENKIRDNIKNKYCMKNGINLIRIKYDDNTENELKTKIVL